MATPQFRKDARTPVSGQMTDSELALEGRVEETLNSPRLSFDAMTPSVTSYAVLKEELGMRSAINSSLRHEQQIAFADSARRTMHDQAVKNDGESTAARDAVAQLPGMLDSGMAFQDAQTALLKKNPGLAFNKHFLTAIKPFDVLTEDEDERFIRQNKTELVKTQITAGIMDAEKAVRDGQFREDNKAGFNRLRENDLENKTLASNIARGEMALEFKARTQAFGNMSVVGKKLGIELATPESIHEFEDYMDNAGIPVQDVQTFANHKPLSRYGAMGLADQTSISEVVGKSDEYETPAQALKAIAVIGSNLVQAKAENGDPVAIEQLEKADLLVSQIERTFRRHHALAIQAKETKELLFEKNKDLIAGYNKATDSIFTHLQKLPEFNPEMFAKLTGSDDAKKAQGLLQTQQKSDFMGRSRVKYASAQNAARNFVQSALLSEGGDTDDMTDPPQHETIDGLIAPDVYALSLRRWMDASLRPVFQPKDSSGNTVDFKNKPVPPLSSKGEDAPLTQDETIDKHFGALN